MQGRLSSSTYQNVHLGTFQHTLDNASSDSRFSLLGSSDAKGGNDQGESSKYLFRNTRPSRARSLRLRCRRLCQNLQATRSGWRFGLYAGLFTSILVLMVNIALLFIGLYSLGGSKSGIGTLATGNGDYIHKVSIVYHVAINVLSTILLVSSNYAMQLLNAPSRAEIDAAHARGSWMEIGIVSLHNLRFINKRRLVLWLILVLSSAPLHIFYNSAVFEVTSGQDHMIDTVNAGTITEIPTGWKNMSNAQWLEMHFHPFGPEFRTISLAISEMYVSVDLHPSNGTWSAFLLPAGPCYTDESIWRPSGNISSSPSKVENASTASGLLVTRHLNLYETDFQNYVWPTITQVSFDEETPIADRLSFCDNIHPVDSVWLRDYTFKVQYALVKENLYPSKIQIALPFIAIVIVANSLKAICIFLTIIWSSTDHILTVGDAISSFLEFPEQSSIGKCLHKKADLTGRNSKKEELAWRPTRPWLASTLGGKRIGTIIICTLAIVLDGAAIIGAIPNTQPNPPGALANRPNQIGWGTASTKIVSFTPTKFDAKSILTNSIIANAPQVVLSFVYFSINRVYTSVCFQREWNNYGKDRKALRVTSPEGMQRSTHFLQLPYRWAVTLALASGFLHWLLSQSIFLTRSEIRDVNEKLYEDSICACGYSPWSLLAFGLAFTVLLVVTAAILLRRVDVWVPVAAHCSAVISAACHHPPDEVDPHLKKVQWGVVRNRFGGAIQHCTFTSEEITLPQEGKLYA